MNKKFYYGIVPVALLLGVSGAVGAIESGSLDAARIEAQDTTQPVITANSPSMTGNCVIEGRDVYVSLTVTAPTEGRDDDWNYSDLAEITELRLYREADSYYDDPTLIQTWTDVKPGDQFTFDDKDESLVRGKEYTYQALAMVGEKEGNKGYCYVTLGITPITPARPQLEPTGTGAPVTVKYVCPETMMQKNYYSDPEPLPDGVTYEQLILSKKSSEGEKVLATHENPVPGTEYTFIDETAPDGTNTYYVKTVTFAGESDQASTSIFLGPDYPSAPTGVSAVESDGKVVVTWTAPTQGYNGGVLDQSKVRYAIYRRTGSDYNNMKLLSDNVSECAYTDNLEDITAETMVYYRVKAYNDVEEPENAYNYSDTYTGIVVGPPAPLPFKETFNSGNKFNKNFDKMWESSFDWSSFSDSYIRYNERSINVGNENGDLTISAGVDGGSSDDENGVDGYFLVTPATYYDRTDPGYLTSGNLSFANATNPYISFYYVPINNSCGTVAVEVNDDGGTNWKEVSVVSYDDPALGGSELTTSLNWTRKFISMKEFSGVEKAKVRIRFKYTDSKNCRYAMLFDNLLIDDYPAVTDVSLIRNDVNGNLELSWKLPESAGDKKVTYNIYLGDEKVASVDNTSFSYADVEQGETYSLTVEAEYADGIVAPKSEVVEYAIPLTSFTVNDFTYYVEGAEVNLASYSGTAESITLPATVEYKSHIYNVVSISVDVFRGNRTLSEAIIEAPVKAIPEELFYGCVSLAKVELPATVETIADKAFFGCAKLESLSLPASLTSIGASAFEHSGLKSIEFADNLTEIGAAAFRYCEALADVTFASIVPPVVGEEAFLEVASPCAGHCPEAALDAYKAVAALSPLTFEGYTGIGEILGDGGDVLSTEYFTLQGHQLSEPLKGQVTLVRVTYSDGHVKTFKHIAK